MSKKLLHEFKTFCNQLYKNCISNMGKPSNDITINATNSMSVSKDGDSVSVTQNVKNNSRFISVTSAGLGVSVQYKPSWGTVGVGVEGGVKNTRYYNQSEFSTSYPDATLKSNYSSYDGNTTGYATANMNASVNLRKGFAFKADGQIGYNARELNIGIRKTF